MARLAYEVNVVNIHFGERDVVGWNSSRKGRKNKNEKEQVVPLPQELTIELPRDFNEHFKMRTDADYFDAIESFVYNNLTKRYHKECTYCQIWIGDDLDVVLKRIEEAKRLRELAAVEQKKDEGLDELDVDEPQDYIEDEDDFTDEDDRDY